MVERMINSVYDFFIYKREDGHSMPYIGRFFLCVFVWFYVQARYFTDPNDYADKEYIMAHGKETIGVIDTVTGGRNIYSTISYTVDSNVYTVNQQPYVNNKLIDCFGNAAAADRNYIEINAACTKLKYVVKYLPKRPDKAFVYFDRPVFTDTLK
jgi:hypothetical protein